MRLICPHCHQSVALPDAPVAGVPGSPVPCPNCGQPITPPALTGAAIDAAPEPPPPAPSVRAGSVSGGPEKPSLTLPARTAAPGSAARPWCHLTLRRDVAHWI